LTVPIHPHPSRTGSLFNHSDAPNVSYSIDAATDSIRYTTVRAVEPDEELCIYYGPNLWFTPVGIPDESTCADAELADDDWGGLSALVGEASNHVPKDPLDPNEILPDEDLPFTRVKLTSDEDDEETLEAVRTGEPVPRVRARLLMPNTSTGMGSRHPRPTRHHLRTEVYSPSTLIHHPPHIH
jgi:tRNA-specific adenosine deaminase 3